MSLCNSVSRIVFKALSWKQRESKLLSHSLYEKNLPACDYPHKTIRTQSSPVLSQPRKKKPTWIACYKVQKQLHHESVFLQKALPVSASSRLQRAPEKSRRLHSRSVLLSPFPAGAAQAERMQPPPWGAVLWSMLPPRDGVSTLCPLHAEGLTPEATFSKQLQNVKSESSESAKTNSKDLNKNPL